MEQKITCLIADDEPMALDLIESYVNKTPFLELRGKCNNGFEVLDLLAKEQIDLLFLDIQMPGLNGLELSKSLRKKNRVIFTTAFDKYALEGFKVEALDYLLKPFDYNEFLTGANKALEWFSLQNMNKQPLVRDEYMFVKADYKLVRIHFDNILYVEGLKDYVKIYIEGERRPILSLTSMRAVEAALPKDKFQRTHRSFIVNLEKVNVLERGQIVFNDKHIPVSDSYKDVVQDYFAALTLKGRNS